MLFFDFRCGNCGLVFEGHVPSSQRTHECPVCTDTAIRLIGVPVIDPRLGVDPAFGTMADKWAKTHRQRRNAEREYAKEHGIN